jgi:hypothetical protein
VIQNALLQAMMKILFQTVIQTAVGMEDYSTRENPAIIIKTNKIIKENHQKKRKPHYKKVWKAHLQ